MVAQADARARAGRQAAGVGRHNVVGAQLDEAAEAVVDQAARVGRPAHLPAGVRGVAARARGAHPPVTGPQIRDLPPAPVPAGPAHRQLDAAAPRRVKATVATAAADAVANDARGAQERPLALRGRAAVLHALVARARVTGRKEPTATGSSGVARASALRSRDSRKEGGGEARSWVGVVVASGPFGGRSAEAELGVGGARARRADVATGGPAVGAGA